MATISISFGVSCSTDDPKLIPDMLRLLRTVLLPDDPPPPLPPPTTPAVEPLAAPPWRDGRGGVESESGCKRHDWRCTMEHRSDRPK